MDTDATPSTEDSAHLALYKAHLIAGVLMGSYFLPCLSCCSELLCGPFHLCHDRKQDRRRSRHHSGGTGLHTGIKAENVLRLSCAGGGRSRSTLPAGCLKVTRLTLRWCANCLVSSWIVQLHCSSFQQTLGIAALSRAHRVWEQATCFR